MPSTKSSSSKTLTRPLVSCPGWHYKLRRWTITLSGLTCITRSKSHSAHTTVGASLRETSLWLPSLTKHRSSKQLVACCHFSLSFQWWNPEQSLPINHSPYIHSDD